MPKKWRAENWPAEAARLLLQCVVNLVFESASLSRPTTRRAWGHAEALTGMKQAARVRSRQAASSLCARPRGKISDPSPQAARAAMRHPSLRFEFADYGAEFARFARNFSALKCLYDLCAVLQD
jgi:hypothetical protein